MLETAVLLTNPRFLRRAGASLALAFLLAAAFACKHEEPYRPTPAEVRLAAQGLITEQLMSPGAILFASEADTSVEELSSGRFRVRSYVDYKGASGMPIRTNFDCVIRCKGKDKWDMADMKWE